MNNYNYDKYDNKVPVVKEGGGSDASEEVEDVEDEVDVSEDEVMNDEEEHLT